MTCIINSDRRSPEFSHLPLFAKLGSSFTIGMGNSNRGLNGWDGTSVGKTYLVVPSPLVSAIFNQLLMYLNFCSHDGAYCWSRT